MLMIRLARFGAKKKPFYRVVVIEKERARNGRSLEVVAERLNRRLSTNDRNLHVIARESVNAGLLRALRKPRGARLLAPLGRRRSLAHDDADALQACLQARQQARATD